MADPVSAVASVQLGFLQAPEIARESMPIIGAVQLANAQAASAIAHHAQEARETVQQLEQTDTSGVNDALSGRPNGEPPSYRDRRRPRPALEARAIPLAAAHPRGLGSTVDIRA